MLGPIVGLGVVGLSAFGYVDVGLIVAEFVVLFVLFAVLGLLDVGHVVLELFSLNEV